MPSLDSIIYCLGEAQEPLSYREMSEILDDSVNRIRSFVNAYRKMFVQNKIGKVTYWGLGVIGKQYYDRLVNEYMYDPLLDKRLNDNRICSKCGGKLKHGGKLND